MGQEYINDIMIQGLKTVRLFGEDDGKPIKKPEHNDEDGKEDTTK